MLVALLAAALATASAEPAEPSVTAPEAMDDRARARVAFGRGREQARAEHYADAIASFEEALRLRPTSGLHYNIAVCHHRLLLAAAEDTELHEEHRAAAVIAYNAYLDAAPAAEDRYAVAATIQDLHGRPNLIDEWRIDGGDPGRATLELRESETTQEVQPQPQTPDPEPTPVAEVEPDADLAPPVRPPPAISPMRPGFPHGMFGLGFSFDAIAPRAMSSTSGIDSLPALGPTLRAGGFIGEQRELLVGAEFAWATTPTRANDGHRISSMQFLLLTEWARAVRSDKRLELGVSATAGLGGQTLVHNGPSPAICPVRAAGVVSTRGGLFLGSRFLVRATFGARRQHAVSLRTGPTLAAMGGGTRDSACPQGDPHPFEGYDVPNGSLQLRSELGYAFRW